MVFQNKLDKPTDGTPHKLFNLEQKPHKAFIFALLLITCYAIFEIVSTQLDFNSQSVPSETNSTINLQLTGVVLLNESSDITSGFEFRNATWKYNVGNWLQSCHSSLPQVDINEKVFGNPCSNKCSDKGVCNYETGVCNCRMGYKGLDCSELVAYPCNLPPTDALPAGPWTISLCSAQCDERTAKCRCGFHSKHPDRYVRDLCGYKGAPTYTGIVDAEILYSKNESKIGWCNADFVPGKNLDHLKYCACNEDGRVGRFCEIKNLAYCVNGCGGHGVCESGYCQCENGWYGIDCSIPSVKVFKGSKFPQWLKKKEGVSVKDKIYEIFPIRRKRPLIYFYELPGEFNFQLFEGRNNKFICAPWVYGLLNETNFYGALYAMELAVYERLLSSQHRTMDAELADYFFVPILGGCVIPRFGHSPKFGPSSKNVHFRQFFASEYYLKAYEYIKGKHPYWDRNEGKDHIWLFPWDEGSCIAPQEIWNSIMITSFGNTMTRHNKSTTAYNLDSWNVLPRKLRGDHPCYDPAKDIILPAFKDPNPKIVNLRLWEKNFTERNILFYFNGNLGLNYTNGRPEPSYSMGIRQKVAYYFGSLPNIHGQLGIKLQENVIVKFAKSPNYDEELSSSRFCGAFPGDGFSARMEDAILSGCIPVIIQDGIHLAFENFLNFDNFTVRINESDIPNMIHILEGISESKVKSMLQAIQGLWQRYTYHSTVKAEAKRQLQNYKHVHEWAKAYNQLQGDDALDTMFQILAYKLYNDPWRKDKRNVSQVGDDTELQNMQNMDSCFSSD